MHILRCHFSASLAHSSLLSRQIKKTRQKNITSTSLVVFSDAVPVTLHLVTDGHPKNMETDSQIDKKRQTDSYRMTEGNIPLLILSLPMLFLFLSSGDSQTDHPKVKTARQTDK